MIFCRLRQKAGGLVIFFLAFGSATALAQAADVITRMEMWTAIVSTVGGGIVLGAGLLAWILSRDREQTREGVDLVIRSNERLADQIEKAMVALVHHDENPYAHPIGSATRLAPLEASIGAMDTKVDALTEKLDRLIWEHNSIQATEGDVCAALRELRHRDPKDSPHPRRQSDPVGFDGTGLRGKK